MVLFSVFDFVVEIEPSTVLKSIDAHPKAGVIE